jgi:hypothetical protein
MARQRSDLDPVLRALGILEMLAREETGGGY